MRLSRAEARTLGIDAAAFAPAKASRAVADAMNGTERNYAGYLDLRKAAGEVIRFDYEPVKLRLADRTWYTPDFRVILADRTEEYHEVKGRWTDDARVKIKVAAELHPYPFVAARWDRTHWVFERFEGKQR